MKNIENIIPLLEKIQKTNVKLTDIKKLTEESVKNKTELKDITTQIKSFYVSEILDRILSENIDHYKKTTISKKIKNFKIFKLGLKHFYLPNLMILGLSVLYILLFGISNNNSFLVEMSGYIALTSYLLIIVVSIVNLIVVKKIISSIEETFFSGKNEFKCLIRDITLELVKNLNAENTEFKLAQENLTKYLIEENYLLEKGNENNIFKDIELQLFDYFLSDNKNKIDNKKILKKEDLNFDGKLNYLIKKKDEAYK